VQTFRKRRAGLSATAGLSCFNSDKMPLKAVSHAEKYGENSSIGLENGCEVAESS